MNAAAVLLALALARRRWGIADFSGGLALAAAADADGDRLSQSAGFVALLVALAVRGGALDRRSFLLGLLAGVGGGAGLAAFYKALSLGTMSIVSPLAACGALVPFTISIATGERPGDARPRRRRRSRSSGAVLASAQERRSQVPDRARAVALALGAAVALGLFTYFLGLGSREGSPLSTLVGARVGSLSLLRPARARRPRVAPDPRRLARCRWPRSASATSAANALFALASGHGLLALVSVLGSLYPVVDRAPRPRRSSASG